MTTSIFDKKQQNADKKLLDEKEKKSKAFTEELNKLLEKYNLKLGTILKYTELGIFAQIVIDEKKEVKSE